MDLRTLRWAEDLCELFGVPPGILPEIRPSSGEFGQTRGLHFLPDGLPILGIAGDQQASLIGQGCVEAGQAKCTYGTGAFLLAHTGGRIVPSRNGLITTLAATIGDQPPQYALEGSVFVAGAAVQWFRDGLKAIGASYEINPLSLESDPAMDVIFVPALTGLGAPYWQPSARGTIFGLTRATSIADLARATLEGVAFQVADLIEAIGQDLGYPLAEIRTDGGMAQVRPVPPVPGGSPRPADPPEPADRIDGPGCRAPGRAGRRPLAGCRVGRRAPHVRRPDVLTGPRRRLAEAGPRPLAARGRDGDPALRLMSTGRCHPSIDRAGLRMITSRVDSDEVLLTVESRSSTRSIRRNSGLDRRSPRRRRAATSPWVQLVADATAVPRRYVPEAPDLGHPRFASRYRDELPKDMVARLMVSYRRFQSPRPVSRR